MHQVSISALSDRIAQRICLSERCRGTSVSISALSDRIAQPAKAKANPTSSPSFNIRSFGSNCSASSGALQAPVVVLFQYPLFRIELLSALTGGRLVVIDDVSISALSDRIAQRDVGRRIIDGIVEFQYPLFRIELLSKIFILTSIACIVVSISALSDRIAQQSRGVCLVTVPRSFNIRSFGSNCSAPSGD